MTDIIINPGFVNLEIVDDGEPEIILSSPGPAGPPGPPGLVVNDVARVDKSVIYYDAATSTYKADAAWTVNTITDGGNF